MKVVVSQIGAREHYVAARALYQQGLLAALVTDWYAFGKQKAEILKTENLKGKSGNEEGEIRNQKLALQPRTYVARCLASVIRNPSALAARCEAIPDGLVRAFPFRSLLWKWRVRRLAALGRSYEAFLHIDAAFANTVARCHLPPHDVFFGYSYASLEIMEAEKKRGGLLVLDQIDPGPVHFRMVAEEIARHSELAGPSSAFPTAYFERNRREWDLADVIVVNSEWSREALISEGVNPAKIEILPLAYEALAENRESGIGNRESELPLRVLWLGQVNVGKGIHYLMEAARLLESENVHFDVVGPIGILPGAVASAPQNMTFHSSISRDRAAERYQQADVFVLPTLSDGFALTQLEALAHGLPVIATPNCGRVVEDGKTGFIVPARDAQAVAATVLKFVADRNLSPSMARACQNAVKRFSVEAYGKRLVEIIEKHHRAIHPKLKVIE